MNSIINITSLPESKNCNPLKAGSNSIDHISIRRRKKSTNQRFYNFKTLQGQPRITAKLEKALKMIKKQEGLIPGLKKTCPIGKNRLALEIIKRNFKLKKMHNYMLDYTISHEKGKKRPSQTNLRKNHQIGKKIAVSNLQSRENSQPKSLTINDRLINSRQRFREARPLKQGGSIDFYNKVEQKSGEASLDGEKFIVDSHMSMYNQKFPKVSNESCKRSHIKTIKRGILNKKIKNTLRETIYGCNTLLKDKSYQKIKPPKRRIHTSWATTERKEDPFLNNPNLDNYDTLLLRTSESLDKSIKKADHMISFEKKTRPGVREKSEILKSYIAQRSQRYHLSAYDSRY
ncbi:unnamed protein product [Moneuplotes crassus]|uniref:Uncharacterized protein n=1 Tax=Euplotes crassus TaxID=5936 RepID=A0AAD1XEF2_EUPCR|nr:unnamed protein product [Moneuplotes crassus]